MAATYTSPWAGTRDQLRFLMQDNATNGVTTAVVGAVLSDQDYDDALAKFGEKAGAVQIAQAYASFYAKKITAFAQGTTGERVQWAERQKYYADLAQRILVGDIAVGTAAEPQVQRGSMTEGADAAAFFRRYGVWPRTTACQL